MRWYLALLLIAAGTTSLWLMIKVVKSERTRLDKFGAFLLLSVPVVGPLLFWFVYNDLPPQHPYLQNRGARGDFTQSWIAARPVLEKILKERQDRDTKENDSKQADP
jgi:hypothetical protein